jgi:hypothetical protein
MPKFDRKPVAETGNGGLSPEQIIAGFDALIARQQKR